MIISCFLVFNILSVNFFAELLVFLICLLHALVRKISDLLKFFEFLIHINVCVRSLGQQHFPFGHIVDGFIVMSDQISFNKGAVSHEQNFTATFGAFSDFIIG